MIYVTGDTHREFSRFSWLELTEDDLIISVNGSIILQGIVKDHIPGSGIGVTHHKDAVGIHSSLINVSGICFSVAVIGAL